MYEIIANPEEYKIAALEEGFGYKKMAFPDEDRAKWADEIKRFANKIDGLSAKAKKLIQVLETGEPIIATPASLKTFKVRLFNINYALNTAIGLAEKLENEIIKK